MAYFLALRDGEPAIHPHFNGADDAGEVAYCGRRAHDAAHVRHRGESLAGGARWRSILSRSCW
jgi:hypothetical protein